LGWSSIAFASERSKKQREQNNYGLARGSANGRTQAPGDLVEANLGALLAIPGSAIDAAHDLSAGSFR
jgi:hypothetical protein